MLQIPSNEFTTSYRGFNLDKLKGFSLNDSSRCHGNDEYKDLVKKKGFQG